MPIFDIKCLKCNQVTEVFKRYEADYPCPECKGETVTLPPAVKGIGRAKKPYDYLNGPIPDSKKIKSFANDRRKGGKDTT